MRLKKIVSGILACAMVVTSVFAVDMAAVKAAEVQMPDPVKVYDFNDGLDDGKAVLGNKQNLADYTGTVVYEAGRTDTDGDKAVKLGDYGIKLSPSNIGANWTVSAWMKPTAAIAGNQAVLFVGYHSPEKWAGIAGDNGNTLKAWTNGSGPNGESYGWATVASPTVTTNEWVMLTLSYANGTMSVYKNGALVGSGGAADALNGENQSVYLGVNYWDPAFPGLADDISIYNQALTARQVRFLYDGKSDAEVLQEDGIDATTELSMLVTEGRKINVTLPSALADSDDITITYDSADKNVATVSDAGLVTGVSAGATTVTTTAAMGDVEVTAETAITVNAAPDNFDENLAAEYDFSSSEGGVLKDISGRGNNAKVVGTDVSFAASDDEGSTGIMTVTGENGYIELPMSIIDALPDQEAFTIETRFAKSSACGNNAWLFCLGSKVKSSGTNYMFLSPNFESKTLRAGIKNSSTEKLFGTSIQPVVDTWYTVDMVFDHGTVKLYWNGVLIQGDNGDKLESGYSIMNDVIKPGTENDVLGFIGKSCWAPDKTYQGKISSFKIYNTALTDEQVQTSRPEYQQALEKALNDGLSVEDILGSNSSESEVRYNLSLPSAIDEIPLTWSITPEGIVSDRGIVSNPKDADQTVTMKAQLKSGALVAEKTFTLTVKKLDTAELEALVASAKSLLAESGTQDKDKLESAITRAEEAIAAASQLKVDNAQKNLQNAMENALPSSWIDPFAEIDDSKAGMTVELTPGTSSKEAFIVIPDSVKDAVTVTYSSSDTGIADVNSTTGIVTAKKAGYSKITTVVKANYDGFEMEYQTLVKVDYDTAGITAVPKKTQMAVGETTTIDMTYPDCVKNTAAVSYQGDDVVTVDAAGTVTGAKAGTGTVTVTVRAGGKIKAIPVTIKVTAKEQETSTVDLSKVSVKAKASKIAKGKTTTLTIKYPNAATKAAAKVTYKASGAVSVNKSGKVTGKKSGKGTVKVTLKASGQKTITKKVTINVGEISGKSKVKVKKSITLKVKGISGKVKWSVNKKKFATISSKGKLKGKKAGKVKVTAKVGKVTMTKTITIKK